MRIISRKRKFLFVIVAVFVSILLCEVALRLTRRFSLRVEYALRPPWQKMLYSDSRLEYRLSPYYPGHDARGFRNERVPDSVDIVTVGDSLTYGYAATAENSWPSHLQRLSGQTTYNGGIPSYDGCEYEVIASELLDLNPRTVILGLYFGNDITGAYDSAYVKKLFPELQSQDSAVLHAIATARQSGTLRELGRREGMAEIEEEWDGIIPWLSRRSSLYALGRELKAALRPEELPKNWQWEESFESAAQRENHVPLRSPERFRTVFRNPRLDALAINVDDPRVREGLRITKAVFLRMHQRMLERDGRFVVVLIHNKPYSYSLALPAVFERLGSDFRRLVELERRVTDEIVDFLSTHSISYADTQEEFAKCFERGVCPYPESTDHHPNSVGYEAIARALLPLVTSDS